MVRALLESEGVIPKVVPKLPLAERFGLPGDNIVITAGIPFGQPGTTNLLRIVALT